MLIAKSTTVFQQRLYRPDGEQIGTRSIATWSGGARNGAPGTTQDNVAKLELAGRTYRLEYELFDLRVLDHHVRYFLVDGATTIATVATLRGGGRRRWQVDIGGQHYHLVRHSMWPRTLHHLEVDGKPVATVRETTRMLALTCTHEVSAVIAFPDAVLAFLYHLVVVHAHG